MTLTKNGIVQKIADQMLELRQRDIMDVVQLTLDCITSSLVAGENVELRNFGVFEVVERKARIGRNPKAPEKDTVIPAHRAVRFRQGKAMRQLVEASGKKN